jgi:hypothetical protein
MDSSTAHTQDVLADLEVHVDLSNSMIFFHSYFPLTHLNIVVTQIS